MQTCTEAPRRLCRPFPLDPVAFPEAVKDLTSAEIGALFLIAMTWWPTGVVPERPADLGRVMGIDPHAAKRMAVRLAPMFEPGSYLAILRSAHVSKAERRAKAGRAGMVSRWSHPARA